MIIFCAASNDDIKLLTLFISGELTAMSQKNNSIGQPCLSPSITLYFLTMISAICSFFLVYFMIIGPFPILLIWITFYLFNRSKPYFRPWTLLTVLSVIIGTYALGIMLCYGCFFLLLSDLFVPVKIAGVLTFFSALLHSGLLFFRQLYRATTFKQAEELSSAQSDSR